MLLFLLSLFLFSSVLTLARPKLKEKKAALSRIKAEIEEIDGQLDDAVEAYNQARFYLSLTKSEINSLNSEVKEKEKQLKEREEVFRKRLKNLYIVGSVGFLEVLLHSTTFDDFLKKLDYFSLIIFEDGKVITDIRKAKRDIEKKRETLLAKKVNQERLVKELKRKEIEIKRKLLKKTQLLASIKSELAQLQREELSQQARLQRKYFRRYLAYRNYQKKFKRISRGAPREDVVGIALSQLGKPYRWGSDGPNSFDCSGLVAYSYAQVGIYLPHSSSAQYSMGEHVSRDELLPGDLVFFSRGRGISHVGIYVGDGNFIHAPQSGDVVKIQPLSSHKGYVGAVRP